MAGPVAAAVYHEQRFARFGQRRHQGMIAPLALVVDVQAFLALTDGKCLVRFTLLFSRRDNVWLACEGPVLKVRSATGAFAGGALNAC